MVLISTSLPKSKIEDIILMSLSLSHQHPHQSSPTQLKPLNSSTLCFSVLPAIILVQAPIISHPYYFNCLLTLPHHFSHALPEILLVSGPFPTPLPILLSPHSTSASPILL